MVNVSNTEEVVNVSNPEVVNPTKPPQVKTQGQQCLIEPHETELNPSSQLTRREDPVLKT